MQNGIRANIHEKNTIRLMVKMAIEQLVSQQTASYQRQEKLTNFKQSWTKWD